LNAGVEGKQVFCLRLGFSCQKEPEPAEKEHAADTCGQDKTIDREEKSCVEHLSVRAQERAGEEII
jgi:hypothetical protein